MFILIRLKSAIRQIIFVALAFITLLSLNNPNIEAAYKGQVKKKLPIYSVETIKTNICLTFDAAWGNDKTEHILNILETNNIKATFFLVGFWIEKYPETLEKINNARMEIGNHSDSHPDMTKLSESQIKKELLSVNEKLEKLNIKPSFLFRPPYGSYDNKVIRTAENLNFMTIQWDVDSLDWKLNKTSTIVENVEKNTKNGSIILFHNNSEKVIESISILIPILKNKGFEFVTVGQLIYKTNFKIDNTGRQILL